MVTPLLPGKTLDRLIPPDGIEDPVEAVDTTVTILRALHHVHASKICHRDIKPGNIMVGNGGIIYVMDFGLAVCHETDTSRLTEYGTTLGTPAYMPPEQAAGETDRIGPWSDQYSCGVVLYKMLTGHVPYPGKGIAVIPDIKDLKKPPIPPRHFRPDLDLELERLILRALEKFPGRRFGSCQEFADHLREWADELKSSRRSPAFGSRIGQSQQLEELPTAIEIADDPPRSGRGWLLVFLLLLFVAGAGVGGWFIWKDSQKTEKIAPSPENKKPRLDKLDQ
jgi:serine/threonine-protein kinase